jgi:hypothetical protein
MRRILGLAIIAVTLAPGGASAQIQGKLQWGGKGDSFISSFQRSSSTVTASYAGAPYKAAFNINPPADYPWVPMTGTPDALIPAYGTGTAFGPAVDILCIDFLHTAKTGTYDVWFTQLGYEDGEPINDLTYTRAKTDLEYRKVAWLATQMEFVGNTTSAEKQTRLDIHAAIWRTLTGEPIASRLGSGSGAGPWSTGLDYWVAQAEMGSNYGSVKLNHWMVVTHTCVGAHEDSRLAVADGCGQEFLVHSRPDRTVTPEPGTMILLGTGLLAMAGMGMVGRNGLA